MKYVSAEDVPLVEKIGMSNVINRCRMFSKLYKIFDEHFNDFKKYLDAREKEALDEFDKEVERNG